MKTVLLIRHSESAKDRTLPTAELPLSERGHIRAREFFSLGIFRSVDKVYSSPYKRAYSTAEKLCGHYVVDDRLREREVGKPQISDAEFWSRQYEDNDYKAAGGESLNDAGKRMTAAVGEIISAMQEESTVAVVSHAAAICAFLLHWCSIEAVDALRKERKIIHNGVVVHNGKIAAPSAFVLHFENGDLCKIRYMENAKKQKNAE